MAISLDSVETTECLKLLSEMGGKSHSENSIFKPLNRRLKRTNQFGIGKNTFNKILCIIEEAELIVRDTTKSWHAVELTEAGRVRASSLSRLIPFNARKFWFSQKIEWADSSIPAMEFSRIPVASITLFADKGNIRVGYESHGTFVSRWSPGGTPIVMKPIP